jgi:hypothetical protein
MTEKQSIDPSATVAAQADFFVVSRWLISARPRNGMSEVLRRSCATGCLILRWPGNKPSCLLAPFAACRLAQIIHDRADPIFKLLAGRVILPYWFRSVL